MVRWGRLLIVAVVFVPAYMRAQSASASLSVTASVSKNCTITTSPVSFGAYDPVVANSTNPLDGTGSVTVTCTKGASATIALGDGGNYSGGNRRMNQGAADFLNYKLYQDSSRSTEWTTATPMDLGAAPSSSPRTFTVYGRVAGGQGVSVGSYVDTVLATVNF